MKNFEEILQKLITEHEFLKDMQGRIVDNHDIMTQNQKHNAENHEVVIHNQSTIIQNQEVIVNNQISIIRNQKQIVQNQVTLDVILQTQIHLLNLVKRLSGDSETLQATESFITTLRESSQENLKLKALSDPATL